MTIDRRQFLVATAAAVCGAKAASAKPPNSQHRLPRLDLHVHLDNSTIEAVLGLAAEREMKFGIVEHAGTKENVYPVVLSNDEELGRYLDSLEGKPVYRGVQSEWTDWMGCFSAKAVARLDYVLSDAMTFPGRDGRRVKLWEAGAEDRVDMTSAESFMDRYVDWYVEIIESQPVDLMANVSWLPAPLAGDYDRLWTRRRVRKLASAAAKHQVALEIGAGLKLPSRPFLEVARECGVRFAFGSNGRYPKMGLIDYSLTMAQELALGPADLFTPDAKTKRLAR